jgi:phenylacetic acid degradation operon negative regulatory protein
VPWLHDDGPVPRKPRSVILDLFGDYLRYQGDEVRLGALTTLLAAFDIAPTTTRVTMSRLRREGWFTTRRLGRETAYRLSPELLEVLDEGRERIFAPAAGRPTSQWTMVIYQVSEAHRSQRHQLRKKLAWSGFGPLTASVWLAPGDRRADARRLVADTPGEHTVVCTVSEGVEHDRELARRCWDLDALAAEYAAFTADHRSLLDRAPSLDGAAALVARTDVVATFRGFPFRDPRLPRGIRPEPWPGDDAREVFAALHATLAGAATAYVRDVVDRSVVADVDSR